MKKVIYLQDWAYDQQLDETEVWEEKKEHVEFLADQFDIKTGREIYEANEEIEKGA